MTYPWQEAVFSALLCLVLFRIALSDLRCRRIPNRDLLSAVGIRALWLGLRFLWAEDAAEALLYSLLLTAGTAVLLLLLRLCGHGLFYGAGDEKYAAVLAFSLGEHFGIALFAAWVTAAILYLAARLRGTASCRIPAAPILTAGALAGTAASLIFSGI